MQGFRPDGEAGFVARLDATERVVLLDVVDEVLALVGADAPGGGIPEDLPDDPLASVRVSQGPVTPPWDPALRRLLPDASRDDPELATEFRRLTEADLRVTKHRNLMRLRAALDAARPELVVVASEAAPVAAALPDLRLVASERLGVRTDADADALYDLVARDRDDDPDDAEVSQRFLATVYVVLSLLQESLVDLMLAGLAEGTTPPPR